MAGDSNSTDDSNSKAPENSPSSESKSPPAPESESETKSPPSPPPSSDDSESKSPPPQSPPPSSPPPSPPSSPPPSPPKSDKQDSNKSPPPPDTSSSGEKSSPPPPDNTSQESSPPPSPPSSPPPSTTSNEQSPPLQDTADGGGNGGGQESPPMTTEQQSTPASPGNSPATPGGAVPSTTTTTTPAFNAPPNVNNYSPNTPKAAATTSPAAVASGGGSGGGGGQKLASVTATSSYSKSSPSSDSPPVGIIAGVAVGVALLIFVAVLIVCLRKKKKKKMLVMTPPPNGNNQYNWQTPPHVRGMGISPPPIPGGPPVASSTDHEYSGQHSGPNMTSTPGTSPGGFGLGFNKSTFTYEELAAATNGFNQANMLGQGGFGYVHKGVLPDGKPIAVKSLKTGSGQGEREFMAEVEMLSRVHHRHLVSLVGYCIANGQRMLVYEFLPNNNLEYHLHKKGDPVFDFPTRLRIALGSAKGLAYLHEDCHPRIIHRDIKASNILLDEKFEAMVADFGLAKLTTDTNTHVSTRVMGTFGYLAPEYASSGKLTEKSDVFSFGVMLLELITGRRPVDPNMQYMEDSLVDWSRPLLSKALETGKYDELVDPKLEGSYNPQEMQRMVACAAASIRHSARKRPKMSQIVRVLEGDVSLEDLNEGTKPGQGSAYSSSNEGSEYDTRAYSADLKKFRQIAFATQDFASSEYGGATTSEDGLEPSSSGSSENSREMKP